MTMKHVFIVPFSCTLISLNSLVFYCYIISSTKIITVFARKKHKIYRFEKEKFKSKPFYCVFNCRLIVHFIHIFEIASLPRFHSISITIVLVKKKYVFCFLCFVIFFRYTSHLRKVNDLPSLPLCILCINRRSAVCNGICVKIQMNI